MWTLGPATPLLSLSVMALRAAGKEPQGLHLTTGVAVGKRPEEANPVLVEIKGVLESAFFFLEVGPPLMTGLTEEGPRRFCCHCI